MDKLNSPAPENVRDSKLLTQVALGQKKADLAIVNTTLLNVYTGELLKQYSVSIKDKWIAYVGEAPNDTIGPHTTVIDAKGKTLIPGLIDGHMHLGGLFLISEFLSPFFFRCNECRHTVHKSDICIKTNLSPKLSRFLRPHR